MSCGEHNEMEENVKKAETSAVPQPFKQRCIITHLNKPSRTVLGRQLLFKHIVIWNYMSFTCFGLMVAYFFCQEYMGLFIPLGVFPYINEITLEETVHPKMKIHQHSSLWQVKTMWCCGILLHN